MRAILALCLFFSSGLAAAQAPAEAALERDAAGHNAQMLALVQLRPEEGWRTTASGLRYRQVASGQAGATCFK